MKAHFTVPREFDTNKIYCFCFQKLGSPGSEPTLVPAKPHPFGWGAAGQGGDARLSAWMLLSSGSGFCFLVLPKVISFPLEHSAPPHSTCVWPWESC